MRQFVRPLGIDRLSLEARVLYTGFALFVLLGLGSSVWLYHDNDLGVTPSAASAYYLGNETQEQAPPARLRVAKTPRQLAETVHFHVFTASIVLLVLGHLFMMCAASTRLKVSVLIIATVATLLHVVAPVGVALGVYGAPALVFPSALVMLVSWLIITIWPIVEMWRPGASTPPI